MGIQVSEERDPPWRISMILKHQRLMVEQSACLEYLMVRSSFLIFYLGKINSYLIFVELHKMH